MPPAAAPIWAPTDSWLGTLFFAFQIYFDFSAYSDMALGSSVMLGIRLPVNFHSPYKAASIIEFWRRWHISLSAFLRDYLYVPLGGNRQRPGAALSQSLHHHAAGRAVARRQLDLHAVGRAAWLLSRHQPRLPPCHQRHATVPPAWRLPLHIASVALTFAATTLAWIVFRAPDLASRAQCGGRACWAAAIAPSSAFRRWRRCTLLLLFAMVWFMPNSMELMWRYRPALPSPYPDQPVEPAKRLSWQPTPLQCRRLWPALHHRGAGFVQSQAFHLFPVLMARF